MMFMFLWLFVLSDILLGLHTVVYYWNTLKSTIIVLLISAMVWVDTWFLGYRPASVYFQTYGRLTSSPTQILLDSKFLIMVPSNITIKRIIRPFKPVWTEGCLAQLVIQPWRLAWGSNLTSDLLKSNKPWIQTIHLIH